MDRVCPRAEKRKKNCNNCRRVQKRKIVSLVSADKKTIDLEIYCSCKKLISTEESNETIPVDPPQKIKKINKPQGSVGFLLIFLPCKVLIYLKILIKPVGNNYIVKQSVRGDIGVA